jgi:hypothetical protein
MTSDCWFRYPKLGDPMPPSGPLLLLTRGGIPIIGHWIADGFFIAWSLMPPRDSVKEALL